MLGRPPFLWEFSWQPFLNLTNQNIRIINILKIKQFINKNFKFPQRLLSKNSEGHRAEILTMVWRHSEVSNAFDKEIDKMNFKHSKRLHTGSLVAFILLGIAWFLDVSGLLSGLLRGF